MIHIDRSRVPPPATLRSEAARKARASLARFFHQPAATRRQRTPPFVPAVWTAPDVVQGLETLFHRKCAFCESRIGGSVGADVEMYRPKWQVMQREGNIRLDGYWWLAYEWSNLYPVCHACNRSKGSRFPIAGTPAAPESEAGVLADEQPLLLDPCADRPEDHLVFADDGTVGSLTERGTTTIQVLGLNRSWLVKARRAALEQGRALLEALLSKKGVTPEEIQALIDDSQEYAGALRQFVSPWVSEREAAPPESHAGAVSSRLDEAVLSTVANAAPNIPTEVRQQAAEHFRAEQRSLDDYSIADVSAKSRYLSRSRFIERIEIRNFRPIEELSLAFAESLGPEGVAVSGRGDTRASWLMLLGENASGKSSVLQAVALALIGRKWRDDLMRRNRLDPARFVRHGADSGHVRVFLSGALEPIEMTFSRTGGIAVAGGPDHALVALLGYGSTRLLPRGGVHPQANFDFARVDNLFNPFEPLNDAGAWLASLPEDTFDHMARALRAPLQLGADCSLSRDNGRVFADVYGVRVPLEELSDGYQAVLALTADVMRVMLNSGWTTMEQAEGIVLLDEVGSHLHPRWRMRVVGSLRETFPRVQFLASTHDPLCLRGLVDAEVVVMRRDQDRRIHAITDLPPVRGLRADQLLTSEYFGLSSTIDPELEDLFTEYYMLLGLARPTAAQRKRVADLKSQLEPFRVLGDNRRERLMLETIDQFLAQERRQPSAARAQLKAATRRKLRTLWETTAALPVTRGGEE